MAYIFGPGENKVANVQIDVDPPGINVTAEIWLSSDGVTKAATSGPVAFVSTGGLQSIALPVTMPAGGFSYGVYLDIKIDGSVLGAYRATEDVIIPISSEPIITW